jgi:hypothetical protein
MNLGSELLVDGYVCSEAKEDKFTPFLSYKGGCGRFVMDEWINKDECAFPYVDDLGITSMNANEMQVFKLWKQASSIYPLLAGG